MARATNQTTITFVENLDKPILVFTGFMSGKAAMKLVDKAVANMNPKLAEFLKGAIITFAGLLGFQKASDAGSDNAQSFAVGFAAAGVDKSVEVISGGYLSGTNPFGLGEQPQGELTPEDIYGEDVDDYAEETDDPLNLPNLSEQVIIQPQLTSGQETSDTAIVSGSDNDDTSDYIDTVEQGQYVEYEEVYEID